MIAYIRHNSSRKKEFQLLTTMVREGDELHVMKRENWPESKPFLRSLVDKYEYLCEVGLPLGIVEPIPDGEHVRFQYLEGKPLDILVSDAVRNADAEAVRRVFQEYRSLIERIPRSEMNPIDDEFQRLFGRVEGESVHDCFTVGCLDLILENIFITEDGYQLLDYEWTFRFPLPTGLVYLRTVLNTYLKYQPYKINELLPADVLLEDFGIERDRLDTYITMEWHFQKAVNQGVMGLGEYLDRYRGILFHRYEPYSSIRSLEAELREAEHRIENIRRQLDTTRKMLLDRDNEIAFMRASRFWRAGELYHRLVGLPARWRK